jgi:hypothetical protein
MRSSDRRGCSRHGPRSHGGRRQTLARWPWSGAVSPKMTSASPTGTGESAITEAARPRGGCDPRKVRTHVEPRRRLQRPHQPCVVHVSLVRSSRMPVELHMPITGVSLHKLVSRSTKRLRRWRIDGRGAVLRARRSPRRSGCSGCGAVQALLRLRRRR